MRQHNPVHGSKSHSLSSWNWAKCILGNQTVCSKLEFLPGSLHTPTQWPTIASDQWQLLAVTVCDINVNAQQPQCSSTGKINKTLLFQPVITGSSHVVTQSTDKILVIFDYMI